MIRTYKLLSLALAVALVALAGYVWWSRDRLVASVNGEAIRLGEFQDAMEKLAGRDVLNQLVSEKLILQAARERKINVPEDQVKAELEKMAGQFGSRAAYQQALQSYGLTEEDLARDIRTNLTLQALSRQGVTVTDQEIEQYFNAHKDELGDPEQVRAAHILVDSEAEARTIISELKEGKDFAALAKARSKDPGSKDQGGDLGYIKRGEMVKEFEEVAFSLPVGQISEPVKTSYGYHVIKVSDHKQARPATLEQAKEQIGEILLAQKAKPGDAVLRELQQKARIEVQDQRYKELENKPS